MKAKKPARKKLSFAVDREEIEINSDWVNAVMGPPAAPGRVFFGPDSNSATVENQEPVAKNAPVAKNTAGEVIATVASDEPVAVSESVESSAAVAASSAEPENATDEIYAAVVFRAPVDKTATVEPVADNATVANLATPGRRARPRPIRRITDGLTPGQYAVYSLMFQHGGLAADSPSRLYRGGYADLCALTGLSKRGIQNIVAELQQKRVISIFQPPGYHRTQTSVYRVPEQEAVVHGWHARGLRFAVGKSKVLVPSATVAVSATG